jgi:GNAT superfamily N-acetyltransferase
VSEFLGIARERLYSPGKIEPDRAVLDAVAERLRARHRVHVVSAEDGLPEVPPQGVVFTMSQGPAALAVLRDWEQRGVRVINSTAAIENCHRRRMLAAFQRHAVAHPDSVLLDADPAVELPDWVAGGAWLKRGDVHATEAGDVVRVDTGVQARAALASFRRRGIARALLQRHVEGEVFKFYAVGDCWLTWFPPAGSPARLTAGEEGTLRELAAAGARALELEVYGGDCIRDVQGALWLIDLNDWPSYAPCRFVAADAIAVYLEAQTE